jgi:hypothetical protein
MAVNDNLVLICGASTEGKSASLRDIENPEGVMYLNTESGKKLPFRSKFKQAIITDPMQVYAVFDLAETPEKADMHTIVVDSQTYLMDMYESLHVLPATDTQAGWQNYQQYFRNLMLQYVARSTKNVIFTAHTFSVMNNAEHIMEKKVPVKGALKNNGIESFFSVIVAAKKVSIQALEGYENPMLNITDEERSIGVKYVFQTRITPDTVNERIRGPMGMWAVHETYIDNSCKLLFQRLKEYYV